jgi:hypothetical protein
MSRANLDFLDVVHELRTLSGVESRMVRLLTLIAVEIELGVHDQKTAVALAHQVKDKAWLLAAAVAGDGDGHGKHHERGTAASGGRG